MIRGRFCSTSLTVEPLLWGALLALLLLAAPAFAQVEEGREAIARGEFARAIEILSAALADNPAPDTYLYLAIAHGNMRDYDRAESVLTEASGRYPQDPRFHNELAGVYLARRNVEMAQSALRQALAVDPNNAYATDLLANIDMSAGEVQSALQSWNRTGRPILDEILHNYYLTFGSWVAREAVAFRPAGILRYEEWKTTEARLFESDNFSNASLEIEPALTPDHYNAVVRTTAKTNTGSGMLFDLVKGMPVQTSYFDLWNIKDSGINFNSSYRWDPDRRRMRSGLKIPLPLPGILFLDVGQTWRSERWDLSPVIRSESRPRARFNYKANALRLGVRHIPNYRVEVGAGFEYVNRDATGDLPELFTDSRNSGTFRVQTSLRFADRRYQNRLNLEGFAARKSIVGDFDYSGATAELKNRFTLARSTETFLDWSFKAGTSHGALPVEDYFVLGVGSNSQNLLRGHSVANHGRYGRGPMGTDFALVNFDIERRLRTIPLFDTFNLPYIKVKAEFFVDAARAFDRRRIFQQGKLFVDTGAGLKLESRTVAFNLILGRSLRDGTGVLYGYIEKVLW
jgi:tetratricopeptide (TPR) repeat protein